jgi:hypothetical protein
MQGQNKPAAMAGEMHSGRGCALGPLELLTDVHVCAATARGLSAEYDRACRQVLPSKMIATGGFNQPAALLEFLHHLAQGFIAALEWHHAPLLQRPA